MGKPLFTGSSVERAIACPASEALPHVNETSEYADRGKAIHEFLAEARVSGKESALAKVPEKWRNACEVIDLVRLPHIDHKGYAAEVAFAYDIDTGTGRVLGAGLDRNYGALAPGEAPLTVDVCGLGADRKTVYVADVKTGRGFVTPARRNPQLLIGALAACRAYGRSRAEVALIHVREDGSAFYDRASFDEFEIDSFALSLRIVAAAVRHNRDIVAAGFLPDVSVGEHCGFCKAFTSCPAQTGLARRMAMEPARVKEEITQALTPELARQAYLKWRQAKDVVDRIGEALEAYSTESAIDLGDGRFYGPVPLKRDYLDGSIVRKVLTQLWGESTAETACSWDSSKAAIKEALRPVAIKAGVPLARLEREALKAIDDEGGLDSRVTLTWKEHVKRKEIAAHDD